MNTTARLDGIYFDGKTPLGIPATISLLGGQLNLATETRRNNYRVANLRLSPRIASADRFIAFPDGGQFQCSDSPALDSLPQEKVEGVAAWLESKVVIALIGIVLIATVTVLGYFRGLPAAAAWAVKHIPMEAEVQLGREGLAFLEQRGFIHESELSAGIQDMVRTDFDEMKTGLPYENEYQLAFRKAAAKVGPNAFALPGGTIVITDALIELSGTREEVAAVLAHEMGHVERRHTLKLVVQDSVIAVVVAAMTGDAASVGVTALPTILAQRGYSRQFETEADDFAFDLLKRHDRSPNSFADIMNRMAQAGGKKGNSGGATNAFLSTHPLTQERIERAREAAKQGRSDAVSEGSGTAVPQ